MKEFKNGVAIMALGAQEKYGIKINLIPCGFSHYNQHLFRSIMGM
jgi:hypothetical protein